MKDKIKEILERYSDEQLGDFYLSGTIMENQFDEISEELYLLFEYYYGK